MSNTINGTVPTDEHIKGKVGVASGYDGESAYEVAVKNGFEGSETEWLASLKGKSGVYVGSGDMPEDCNVQIDPNGECISIDNALSSESTNPVMNKVVTEELNKKPNIAPNIGAGHVLIYAHDYSGEVWDSGFELGEIPKLKDGYINGDSTENIIVSSEGRIKDTRIPFDTLASKEWADSNAKGKINDYNRKNKSTLAIYEALTNEAGSWSATIFSGTSKELSLKDWITIYIEVPKAAEKGNVYIRFLEKEKTETGSTITSYQYAGLSLNALSTSSTKTFTRVTFRWNGYRWENYSVSVTNAYGAGNSQVSSVVKYYAGFEIVRGIEITATNSSGAAMNLPAGTVFRVYGIEGE